MTGPLDRLDGSQYGDPDDHRPAHVAPPEADDGADRDDDQERVERLRRRRDHTRQMPGILHRAEHTAEQVEDGGER